MAKCPNCGGELHPQENGLWKCESCGKNFSAKRAPVQDTVPANQTEAELRARLAAMEARQAETERQLAAARANSGGGNKAAEFFKNKQNILKFVIPGALVFIVLIILLVFFCGLRGIYVNVENPNEYYSFGVGTFSTVDGDDVIEGKWSRDGNVLSLTIEDEMFGEIEYPVVFRKVSGYDVVEFDGSEYRRVSLIRMEDNIKKIKVKFDANGGYTEGTNSYELDLGDRIAAAPEAKRNTGDYVFMGWYTSPDGWLDEHGEMFSSGVRLWEDVTYYANWRNDTDYTMTIPAMLRDKTEVEEITYREGDDLLSIFMTALRWSDYPEGVTGIAFVDPSDNTVDAASAPAADVTAKIVGDYMVMDGVLMYVDPSLTEFVTPASATSIAGGSFSNCSKLVSVTIGANVNSLEERVFRYCNSLTTLNVEAGNATYHSSGNCVIDTANKALLVGCKASVIPTDGSVTSIGNYAFASCGSSLTSITIPNSVTSIGRYAFWGCRGLTSVTIPDSVTSIRYYAFAYCEGLTSVVIGKGVESIERDAFLGCSGLKSIAADEDNAAYASVDGILYNKAKTQIVIVPSAIEGSITILEGVTSIGDSTFSGCAGLTSVTIPDSVTSIGSRAFFGCDGVIEVVDGISYVDRWVVDAAGDIATASIKEGTRGIAAEVFYDRDSLTSVTIPDSVTSISSSAFDDCDSIVSATMPAIAMNCIPKGSLQTVVLTSGDIKTGTFENCDNLTSVTMEEGVTSIGERAFNNCTGLTSITIPDSVTSIGKYAFQGCTGLTSVTIGDGVKSIGWYSFHNCTGLTSITIPNSVTSIEYGAFSDCRGLISVTFKGTVSEWKKITRSYYWNMNCPFTEVVCSDGTVSVPTVIV